MTFAEYLNRHLEGDPGVAAKAGARIYSDVLPQGGQFPAVVFTVISALGEHTFDGPSGIDVRRVQVDAWGKERPDASKLAIAIRAALDGHTGARAGLEISGSFWINSVWDFDPEVKAFRESMDFEMWVSGETA